MMLATFGGELTLLPSPSWVRGAWKPAAHAWRGDRALPLVAPPGEHVPCEAPLPSAAQCNVAKRIPVSAADMPRAGAQRWGAGDLPPGGCCAMSDAYRFIFVRTPKAGSTTVFSAFLRPAVCPPPPPSAGDAGVVTASRDNAGGRYRFSASCTPELFSPLDSDCLPCSDIPRWKWLHYFVFSTVREPFSRAVSSYFFCAGANSTATFAEFCVNPDALRQCAWLAPQPQPAATPLPNGHWVAQAAGICHAQGCVVDFVVRADRFAQDMDSVVASINANRRAAVPPLPLFSSSTVGVSHRSSHPPAAAIYSQPDNAHCVKAVAAWYAADFVTFGFATELPLLATG